jgi:hypothetical protein
MSATLSYTRHMKKWYWRAVAGIFALGVIVVIVLLALPKPPIPGNIKQQLTSTLLVPQDSRFIANRQSVKYDSSLKLLTFNVAAFGQQLVVSEQPTPETFVDIPQVYQKVLDGMNDYYDFDVNIGSVHLTKPPQLKGKQAAVLNAKGTLLFAKPGSGLTQAQWQQFFNSLAVLG